MYLDQSKEANEKRNTRKSRIMAVSRDPYSFLA
nr:MAG TPA: hypothetical protein [Caudoviricetes sp.]